MSLKVTIQWVSLKLVSTAVHFLLAVYQKVLRTNYICAVWYNAVSSDPPPFSAVNNGSDLMDGKYHPRWFDGDPIPMSLDEIVVDDNEITDSEDDICETDTDSLSDTNEC